MRPDDYGVYLDDSSCGTLWWYTGDPDNPDSSTIDVKITNPYTDYLTKKQSDEIYFKDFTSVLLGASIGLGATDLLAFIAYYYFLKQQQRTPEIVFTDFHGRFKPSSFGNSGMLIESKNGADMSVVTRQLDNIAPNECVVFYRINKGKAGRDGRRL
jgi:hypothetical protein